MGFSLVELMVVITILLILAGMVMTAAWSSRQKAQQTYCLNNLRQMAIQVTGAVWMGSSRVGSCPAGCEYAPNRYVSSPEDVSNPSGTVLYFESESAAPGTEADVVKRHLGGANFAFCDGHARWSRDTPSFGP